MARITASHAAPDAPIAGVSGRPVLLNLLLSLRPGQWTKNLLVFAGLLFGRRLFDPTAVAHALAAFAIFCALSGVVYLINDVADREADRRHPLKMRRPIASGALPVPVALGAAGVIGLAALAAATALGWTFTLVAALYLALLVLYSGPLKNIVIIDVLTIAIGFVLRAAAGAVAVDVEISHWLLVCTILLALFIALAKRRHEIVLLADDARSHRAILGEYTPYLLDQMIAVVTASTLISYAFYTISPETELKFGTAWLGLTIPFPLYGIFRYLYLVHRREGGGSPSDLLLTDRPLLVCVALWALTVALLIYRPF
ncbi:MAG TPA: decaprenyl-phosphate phosphoribosyltransferase [Vicinamibacterales bacterium]|jgi:4-hydroxybenzoate polyprenyltransferase|nr:decaprenyl-phosphate phosphoribosyltransferase [Vicinamibacterales bacterium]